MVSAAATVTPGSSAACQEVEPRIFKWTSVPMSERAAKDECVGQGPEKMECQAGDLPLCALHKGLPQIVNCLVQAGMDCARRLWHK